MVLSANGQLDNPGTIAAALRRDAEANGGYAPRTRTVTDRGMHRSLTSPAALEELAKAAGVL
jgi:hypothetical protein